ncbi:MGH1-like glycoside hydrolase domain-containing protein [Humisphaera borealis]|uniref:Glucosidase n=1 Tax=Humisphaera borealis TaxID=2807512 RepID=A0A7M2X3F0_9BACT|nr:hypothetical protein [Humisphaera borealis]QOV92205.1 glucosidase [Humisphaera borealis]
MADNRPIDSETERMKEDTARAANWKRWGPYLSDRQWGTVREDYSADGSAWGYLSHDHARSRAYRWGEDGILGICDRECRLCFGVTLWNGKDPILKERLFGLTNPEGNHGEDPKELWWHLDATPTSAYLKGLYRYPQAAFPYQDLITENARRGKHDREYEIQDTGVFDDGRYFDVLVEYAKAASDDILIRITVTNHGREAADLHLLPTLWYRNAWSWGCTHEGCYLKPLMNRSSDHGVLCDHMTLGKFHFEIDPANMAADSSTAQAGASAPRWLFTDNETNTERIFGEHNYNPYVKDAFHEFVVHGNEKAVNPKWRGTKTAPHYKMRLAPGEKREFRLRLFAEDQTPKELFGPSFDAMFVARTFEADLFYERRIPTSLPAEERRLARLAYAGLLWSKQFYHYVIKDWIAGDPNMPPPPPQRKDGRNSDWGHLFNRDVISMPDKWEYPWYASWDLAFHMIPMAHIDPEFAKDQLLLFLREWYMHPNGQLPAYEWALGDVNPPVHAWACWRVYKIGAWQGGRDKLFLRRAFQKLLINFTWWVNRKDVNGKQVFAGGFLGMDNISLFDRSAPLPDGTQLSQADGTAWMAFYCNVMLDIALELAADDPAYEDVASKFFEHFIAITDAMNTLGGTGLWDDEDGFYYDQLAADGQSTRLRVRSMVGLIPLLACQVLDGQRLERFKGFAKRTRWFMEHRADLARFIAYMEKASPDGSPGGNRYLLAVPSRKKLVRTLKYVLDENEFLSPYGIRSMSRYHLDHPLTANVHGQELCARYVSGESETTLFGGNSNWRGPIWFPTNFLLIEALQRYHHFYGDSLKVECPTGSGILMNLEEVAQNLERRLVSIFLPDDDGKRPCNGGCPRLDGVHDKSFGELVHFHEYFDGDTGRGMGAPHQTGWTALLARVIRDVGRRNRQGEVSAAPRATPET